MRRALLLVVLLASGCGSDGGLSRDEAATRAAQAVQTAQQEGTIATQLDRAMTPDADGAMGQAGGSAPGITRVDVDVDHGTLAQRGGEWVAAYDMRRGPVGLKVCVYVTESAAKVAVKRGC